MASSATTLRLVHVAGAGTDNISFGALAPDVLVANTFHHEKSIAEYVVAAAVMLRRGFVAQDAALRRGCGRRRSTTTASHSRIHCRVRGWVSWVSATSATPRGICSGHSARQERP